MKLIVSHMLKFMHKLKSELNKSQLKCV